MEALGRLASGIAHDFNNILTLVSSYAEFLARELAQPLRSDALEILKAVDRGAAMTRRLLAIGHSQPAAQTPVDLNRLLTESDKMLRRLLGPHIALTTDLAPELEMVNADCGQLNQVVLNLAINARDAMPAGGSITIRTSNVDLPEPQAQDSAFARAGRYVMMSISDSGTGMSSEVKAQIFEPFFTTKQPGRGSGLGLVTVRDIVHQGKGFIVVDSTLGLGTTFAVYLPVA
jgi:signal transduction histidine kinase